MMRPSSTCGTLSSPSGANPAVANASTVAATLGKLSAIYRASGKKRNSVMPSSRPGKAPRMSTRSPGCSTRRSSRAQAPRSGMWWMTVDSQALPHCPSPTGMAAAWPAGTSHADAAASAGLRAASPPPARPRSPRRRTTRPAPRRRGRCRRPGPAPADPTPAADSVPGPRATPRGRQAGPHVPGRTRSRCIRRNGCATSLRLPPTPSLRASILPPAVQPHSQVRRARPGRGRRWPP